MKDTQRFSISERWLLSTYPQTGWPQKSDGMKQSYILHKTFKAITDILKQNSKVPVPFFSNPLA